MNIKYVPADENHPANKKAHTNIGEWYPNEVKGVSQEQEKEAAKLIANGEFVETDEEPNSNEIALALNEDAAEEFDEISDPDNPDAAPRKVAKKKAAKKK